MKTEKIYSFADLRNQPILLPAYCQLNKLGKQKFGDSVVLITGFSSSHVRFKSHDSIPITEFKWYIE
jgi:hypothetical protein